MISELIDDGMNESFVSFSKLLYSFNRHCLAGKEENESTFRDVRYDFNELQEYKEYEQELNSELGNADVVINSLYNAKKVMDGFRRLFEGNTKLFFTTYAGFRNEVGRVSIGFRSYANDVTKNYAGNTFDFAVMSGDGRHSIVTLFPISEQYINAKFTGLIQRYHPDKNLKFNIDAAKNLKKDLTSED